MNSRNTRANEYDNIDNSGNTSNTSGNTGTSASQALKHPIDTARAAMNNNNNQGITGTGTNTGYTSSRVPGTHATSGAGWTNESLGRGGAGNIGTTTGTTSGVQDNQFANQPQGILSDNSSGAYSTGRGGAGNIQHG